MESVKICNIGLLTQYGFVIGSYLDDFFLDALPAIHTQSSEETEQMLKHGESSSQLSLNILTNIMQY